MRNHHRPTLWLSSSGLVWYSPSQIPPFLCKVTFIPWICRLAYSLPQLTCPKQQRLCCCQINLFCWFKITGCFTFKVNGLFQMRIFYSWEVSHPMHHTACDNIPGEQRLQMHLPPSTPEWLIKAHPFYHLTDTEHLLLFILFNSCLYALTAWQDTF